VRLVPVLLTALALAAVGVPVLRRRHGRQVRLERFAATRGWKYYPQDPLGLLDDLKGFWLTTWGHDHRLSDLFAVPHPAGQVWVACLSREMAFGVSRRTERFCVGILRDLRARGGMLIVPQGVSFSPVGAFSRYRNVALEGAAAERLAGWAERPISDGALLSLVSGVFVRIAGEAFFERRGPTAVIYVPLVRQPLEDDFAEIADLTSQVQSAMTTCES